MEYDPHKKAVIEKKLTYTERLHRQVDAVSPGLSSAIERISIIDPAAARKVLDVLVAAACRPTNHETIMEARRLIAKISPELLKANLSVSAQEILDLDEEWEFGRWLELLKEIWPSEMARFITQGLTSKDPAVRETSQSYASGVHGPVEGMPGSAAN